MATDLEKLKRLHEEFGLAPLDYYKSDKQRYTIITRSGIEKIERKLMVTVNFEVISCEKDFCCIKASAVKQGRTVHTFGSAIRGDYVKKGNKTVLDGSTGSYYVMEMAEKRARSRAVLKLADLYEDGYFGEDENPEEFKNISDAKKEKSQKALKQITD